LSPNSVTEVVWALGHPNIVAVHPTTLMITKDRHISKKGDCIFATAADKSVEDLGDEFKGALREPNSELTITIEVGNLKEQISACGSKDLILIHPTDIVIRKSSYICSRTIATYSNKASIDLPRDIVEKLKDSKQQVKVTLTVKA
jgi:hypothetical protein